MHMPGSEYLVALAAIAMAFVAFSVIVLVLRQITGGALTPFHTLLVRYTVECGLIAAAFALLPPLLALTELSDTANFRISSAVLAVTFLAYFLNYVRRRRTVMPGPLPPRFLILAAISVPMYAALAFNAGAVYLKVAIWPYAFFVTWILVQAGVVFLLTIDVFLQQPPGDGR
ncbi:MAG: hypothetical protein U1F58_08460 [Burkholderiales bacterium]